MNTAIATDAHIAGLPIEHLKRSAFFYSLWAEATGLWIRVFYEIRHPLTPVDFGEGVIDVDVIRQELITLVRTMLREQSGISQYIGQTGRLLAIECSDDATANLLAHRINGRNPDGSDMFSIFDTKEQLMVLHENGSKRVRVSGFPVPPTWLNGIAPNGTARRFNFLQQRRRFVGGINMLGTLISGSNCVSSNGEMHFDCDSVIDARGLVQRIWYYSQRRFIKDLMSKC